MSPQSILTTGSRRRRQRSGAKHVRFNPITTSYGPVQHLSDITTPPPPSPHTVEPAPYVDTWELRQYLIRLEFHGKQPNVSCATEVDYDVCDDDYGSYSESNDGYADGHDAHHTADLTEQQQLEYDWHTRGSPLPGLRMKELGKKGIKDREEVVRRCHYAWQMERRRLDNMNQKWQQMGREKDTLAKRVKEGLGRAEWELAIIRRRRMRELGVEVRVGTDAWLWAGAEVIAPPIVGGKEDDSDHTMVGADLDATDMEDLEEFGSLEHLQSQYAAVQQQRKVLDVKSSNQSAMVASETTAIGELLCERKKRKRNVGDLD